MCKQGNGVGPDVTEPLGRGHCTLFCIFLLCFVVLIIERNSEEYSMHEVFLLGSHLETEPVENVENMLDCREFLNLKHTIYSHGVMVKLCNVEIV